MATHNKAGEITFRQLGKYSYEATLTTYTDPNSGQADRPDVFIVWGDGDSNYVHRDSQITIGPAGKQYWKNTYIARHDYRGPGTYNIHFFDPNRVANIVNMSNSVSVPFYIESILVIDPARGFDNSPVLLQPPIDYACVGRVFTHNPNAYDADGDSMTFTLIAPRREKNTDVPGYFTPQGANFFRLDIHSGQLTWDYPQYQGIYNIAIRIDEYRKDLRTGKYRNIGYVIRDMQIIVGNCQNHPPVIGPLRDTCVEAGQNILLKVKVNASDPDVTPSKDIITLSATGGPFLQKVNKARMTPDPALGAGTVSASFEWLISCEHIRKDPYRVVFRAVDDDPSVPLSDLKYMNIRVVGPPPQNLAASVLSSTVTLKWDAPVCANARGYLIYRKSDSTGWQHGYCETGVPSYTGYVLIDTIYNPGITTYDDNNRGIGLSAGIIYCYRVTALYLNDGQQEFAEGYASPEVCVRLKKDVPVITNASVVTTSNTTGSVYVAWSKPTALDTLQNPGPYAYKLYRATGFTGGTYTLVNTFTSAEFAGLNDTIYIDTPLNTAGAPYNYRVDLFNTINDTPVFIGHTTTGSTIFLLLRRTHRKVELRWNVAVPWRNTYYAVERKNAVTGLWDSIGFTTNTKFYADTGLVNGQEYCYRIRSYGTYNAKGLTDPIINLSQEICASPRDTIRPCPPILTAAANCESKTNTLQWVLNDSCARDAAGYRIYFSNGTNDQFSWIDSVRSRDSVTYTDSRKLLAHSLAGCYKITVYDSAGNESPYSDTVCVDNCPRYNLPNVFTPNGDEKNDLFVPMPGYRFIESINLHIYNRWGQEVFSTTDPAIRWDGVDAFTGHKLVNGVYFYICEVNEIYLSGPKKHTISGTVEIIR
jgi:gliding motility-associated-like protein